MKPKILCHMMSSVDGRLLPNRYTQPFNGKSIEEFANSYFSMSDQFESDGVIIGRNTLQEFFIPELFKCNNYSATENFQSFIAENKAERTTIVLDAAGKTSYKNRNGFGDNIITVIGEEVSEEYLDHLKSNNISYVFAGKNGNDLPLAMEKLYSEFGLENLLLEGGGIINGAFLHAGLISELSLMIYPGIDGLKGSPTIFDYRGEEDDLPAFGQSLEHISTEILTDGMVWIRYNFHKISEQ